jgi:hypothetical protein
VVTSEKELLSKVEAYKDIAAAYAQGGTVEESEYRTLRHTVLNDPRLAPHLPAFVRRCRNLSEFWDFISGSGRKTYASRREFLREQFDPIITQLERGPLMPPDDLVSAALSTVDSEHVRAAWSKALERRNADSEGAITAARTLVETVCKYILDETSTAYNDKDDLPKLYHKAAEQLNLAPSQHTEQAFKQILGGCQTVVNELAGLRNRLSDAHGKGKVAARPAARHAELAVNLAGTMATFLISTWEARKAEAAE